MGFWDLRNNIKNRPSVSNRTSRVIEEVMDVEGVAMGVAIEMLMRSDTLWDEVLEKLNIYDKDIKKGKINV